MKLTLIEWIDADSDCGEEDLSTWLDRRETPYFIWTTVGLVMAEDDHMLYLAHDWAPGKVNARSRVPKAWVVRRLDMDVPASFVRGKKFAQ